MSIEVAYKKDICTLPHTVLMESKYVDDQAIKIKVSMRIGKGSGVHELVVPLLQFPLLVKILGTS